MTSKIGWAHPIDHSDQWDGFNDSGLAHFSGDPVRNLAREVIQNAYDAKGSGIVEVRIKKREVDTSSIPDLKELMQNFESCHESSKSEVKKAETFFEGALSHLKKNKIAVLEISDYNTIGMKGPSENGTPFYAFMKARGQSRKVDDSASGSYGIGKFAPYVVSNLRTIFISTVYQGSNGKHVQLTQGKSILMSHDRNGARHQGVGFWGVKNRCQPLKGIANLPDWLLRSSDEKEFPNAVGSKLSILGFDSAKNWQEHLAVSVAENFFAAIADGELRVDIDGLYTLDQTTIHGFLQNEDIRSLISKLSGEPERFDNSRSYLQAYAGGVDVIIGEHENPHLGFCQIKIIIGEGLPKKVCALRNGMFITDSLMGLKSFSDFKEFVAVFHCQSQKGNELLRAMEPPRHDDFEPPLLPTRKQQREGRSALKSLAAWIREELVRHAKDPVSDVTEIDELKDFFGDEGASDTGKGSEEINPYGDVVIRAKPIKAKAQILPKESGKKDSESAMENHDDSATNKPPAEFNNVRAILLGNESRRVSLTPVKTGKIMIHIKEAGADSDYGIDIAKSDKGHLKRGGVLIDVVAGNRISLDIQLAQTFSGALKVVAHEV